MAYGDDNYKKRMAELLEFGIAIARRNKYAANPGLKEAEEENARRAKLGITPMELPRGKPFNAIKYYAIAREQDSRKVSISFGGNPVGPEALTLWGGYVALQDEAAAAVERAKVMEFEEDLCLLDKRPDCAGSHHAAHDSIDGHEPEQVPSNLWDD